MALGDHQLLTRWTAQHSRSAGKTSRPGRGPVVSIPSRREQTKGGQDSCVAARVGEPIVAMRTQALPRETDVQGPPSMHYLVKSHARSSECSHNLNKCHKLC